MNIFTDVIEKKTDLLTRTIYLNKNKTPVTKGDCPNNIKNHSLYFLTSFLELLEIIYINNGKNVIVYKMPLKYYIELTFKNDELEIEKLLVNAIQQKEKPIIIIPSFW